MSRNVLGTRNLSEILSDRENIADSMHHSLVRWVLAKLVMTVLS